MVWSIVTPAPGEDWSDRFHQSIRTNGVVSLTILAEAAEVNASACGDRRARCTFEYCQFQTSPVGIACGKSHTPAVDRRHPQLPLTGSDFQRYIGGGEP